MSLSLHTLVIRTFASVEAKDLDGTMSLFAEDAVVIDPHFRDPRIEGKAAITRRIPGGDQQSSHSFGYTTVNYLESADGQCAAVETATHHVLK
jgi:ketosteroid isomerase-like protein